jgi:DNA-binding HxlR family transcriptional regulator
LHDESQIGCNINVSARCPIARSLERVGEWWIILIIRDALHGFARFDEFQKSLNIAPDMLTRRLSGLVDTGLLERRRYSQRPPRYEYILTERGRDFRAVLMAMICLGKTPLRSRGRERSARRQKDLQNRGSGAR